MGSLEIFSPKETILLDELRQSIEGMGDKIARSDIQSLFDDIWYLIMLRCNDLNVSAALESTNLLQKAVRHTHSDWFRKFRPEVLKDMLTSDAVGILKEKDIKGNTVLLIRIKSWNTKAFALEDVIISIMILSMELLERDVQMQTDGNVIVIDVSGMSFAQVRQVTPFQLKKFIDLVFLSTPLKFNGIHVVNLNYMVNALVNIAKPLLPKKIAALLFTHNSPQTLHNYVQKRSLPTWLGGECSYDDVSNSSVKDSCFNPNRTKFYNKFVEIASEEKK